MFNFLSSYSFRLFFCFLIQIFSFNFVEAKTESPSNFEFNVDAIMNCNNLDDQIDNFINIGLQCQQVSSKKFKYKKYLKYAYKHLEKHNISVDKKTKKSLKKRVQNRISEQFFGHHKNLSENVSYPLNKSKGKASSENPNGEYSNDFMIGIVEIAIGGAGAYFGPTVEIKAGGVCLDMV